jgi:hypothetical protein
VSRLRAQSDELTQLISPNPLASGKCHELVNLQEKRASLWRANHANTAPSGEVQQAFVAQRVKSSDDGVLVHSQDGRNVHCRRKALTGLRLAVGDRTSYLGRDLLVKVKRILLAHLAEAGHTVLNSTIGSSE